jgi:hypothetical protein
MDYPAPLISVTSGGRLDFSDAYAVEIGAWDVLAVRYAYHQVPPGQDEQAALQAIIDETLRSGLLFLSDEDARPAGSAHPMAHLWDNGRDPVAALQQTLAGPPHRDRPLRPEQRCPRSSAGAAPGGLRSRLSPSSIPVGGSGQAHRWS